MNKNHSYPLLSTYYVPRSYAKHTTWIIDFTFMVTLKDKLNTEWF